MTRPLRPMLDRSPIRLILIGTLALAGCNGGVAAIVGASAGSDNTTNAAPSVAELGVSEERVSPARIAFTLTDNEGDTASVALSYSLDGGAPVEVALAPGEADLVGLATSANGVLHERLWDFDSQLGSGFEDDLTLTIEILSSGGGTQTVPIAIGNDAPVIANLVVPDGEITEVAVLEMEILDSSSDLVQVVLEYDVQGDDPDLGFQLATAAGTGAPPVGAAPDGVAYTFFWDVLADLGFSEVTVELRFSADDGDTASAGLVVSVEVDNNSVPTAFLENINFVGNPDVHDGIPLGFRVFDGDASTGEPADQVQLVFQWRDANEPYPSLPSSPSAIQAIVDDSVLRQQFQIASEKPRIYQGFAHHASGDTDAVRLPELATTQFGALRVDRHAGTVELDGELEILHGHSVPFALSTMEGLLQNPVGAVQRPGTNHVLVLEDLGGSWLLREFDLARGEVVGLDLAGASLGTVTALALEGPDGSVLIASDNAGTWCVQRAGPAGVTDLIVADGLTELGPVRGLVALGHDGALITVGSSLIRLSYPQGEVPRAEPIFSPATADDLLRDPWGLALDPREPELLYLAENGADRVLQIDLETLERRVLPTVGIGFPAPEAIALEEGGSRLLVITDADGFDGLRELRALDIGEVADIDGDGAADPEVFEILPGPALDPGLPGAVGGVAAGTDGLRLVALTSAGELAVGGGIEQVRTITGYDHATQTVRVSPDFDPPFVAGEALRPWRLEWFAGGFYQADPAGASGIFLWDSSDTASKEVELRMIPLDSDVGIESDTGQERTVFPVFGGESVTLGSNALTERARFARVDDMDGDGDLDLVSGNWQTQPGISVFFQLEPGVFSEGEYIGDSGTGAFRVDSLELTDLDGDGDTDVVAEFFDQPIGSGGNQVGVYAYFQTSPGVYGDAQPIAFPAYLLGAADLDGDGDTDLLVQAGDEELGVKGNKVEIYFQGPGGDFLEREDLGPFPVTLGTFGTLTRIGDLDSDGDLDLVLSSTSGSTYLEQVQPGEFEPGFIDLVGLDLEGLLLHDVDLDGQVDLVYSSGALTSDAKTVARMQVAPGEFGEEQFLADWSSADVAFGDIDRDGDADMALSTPGPPSVRVLLRDEQGVLQPATSLSNNNSSSADVDLADMDGDGRLDLIVADTLVNTVAVHFGDHRPDLTLGPIIGDVGEGIDGLRFVDQGDLDGDGDLDLAITGSEDVEIHYQELPGVYVFGTALLADSGSGLVNSPRVSRTADVDLDGLLDVVAVVGVDLVVFVQATDGSFSFLPQGVFEGGGLADDFEVVDLDGDGLMDVVAAYRDSTAKISVFYQEAPGSFAAAPQIVGQIESAGPVNASIADMDGDGTLDLVRADPDGGKVDVFVQTAPREFTAAPSIASVSLVHKPFATAVADMDGNGRPDVVASGGPDNGPAIEQTLQARDGSFGMPSVVSFYPPSLLTTLAGPPDVADIDGDGDLDFVVSIFDLFLGSGLVLHTQVRPGVFARGEILGKEFSPIAVNSVFGDFDSDGDLDAGFASPFDGRFWIYFGSH